MKCSIQGCPGSYEPMRIVHAIKRSGEVIVFENVPADVCDVCSDVLLAPATIRHIEALLRRKEKPVNCAPLYHYA